MKFEQTPQGVSEIKRFFLQSYTFFKKVFWDILDFMKKLFATLQDTKI